MRRRWGGKQDPGRTMTVESVMSRDAHACHLLDTLHEAARLMWNHDCGCVPIVDDERVVGMLTDRDICMAAYTQGKPLSEIKVSSAMSQQVYACNRGDSPSAAQEQMATRRVRRLPVVEEDGHLVGIVSLSDLARGTESAGQRRKKAATNAEIGHTFTAICSRTMGEANAPAT